MSVVADAVPPGRVLVAPAKEWEVQDYARDRGCRVAVFSDRDDVTRRDRKVARSAGWVAGGEEVVIEHRGRPATAEPRRENLPPGVQAAATLIAFTLGEAARR